MAKEKKTVVEVKTETGKVTYNRATIGELIGFGTISLRNIAFITMIMFFMPYGTNTYGVSVATMGIIIGVSKLFDAITDPIMGTLMDKTKTKMGKYRPWLIAGTPLMLIPFIGMFWGPDLSPAGRVAWLTVMYLIYTLGWTMTGVSRHALRSVITNDPVQRGMISAPSTVFATISQMLVAVLTLPLVGIIGKGNDLLGYRQLTIFYSIAILIAILITMRATKRSDKMENYKESKERVTIKEQWNTIKTNSPLIRLIIACSTNLFAASIQTATMVYIFLYVVKNIKMQPIASLVSVVVSFIAAMIIVLVIRKVTKKKIFVLGSWLGLVVPIILVVFRPYTQIPIYIVLIALATGIGNMTNQVQWMMLPDCVEYGEWKTGKRTAGIISSSFMFANKVGQALGPMVVGLVLGAVGFIEGASVQSEQVITALILLSTLGPILGHIASIIAMKSYPLTRDYYNKILAEIQSRKKEDA